MQVGKVSLNNKFQIFKEIITFFTSSSNKRDFRCAKKYLYFAIFSSCISKTHISVPGLPSKEISAFLSSLVKGGEDVFASRDLQRVFFPTKSGEFAKLEPKRRSSVKEEVEGDEGEDEFEDFKDAFEETPVDTKDDNDVEANSFEDTYDDPKSPAAYSDEESHSENDGSSDDSDYEKPKKKKTKRKYNLSNLKQFHGRSQKEIEEANTTPSKKQKGGRGKFFCSVCEIYFRQESTMLNHVMKKHGPAPPPQCDICFMTFETRPKFQYHRATIHSEKVPCEDCGKSYPKSTMNDHMKQVHDVCDPRTCEHCGSVFTNKKKFNIHVKGHTNPEVYRINPINVWMEKIKENCRCNIEFPSKKSHIEHYKLVHENFQECPKCSKIVRNLDERGHRCEKPKPRTPTKGSTCPECGKYYESAVSMWYHINATHSKTPASCEICGKVFKSRIHMKSHMKTNHESEKSACVLCGKQVSNMKEHIGSVHTADYNKPFKCDHCGKGFVDNRKLRDHMNIHLNVKPYACR